VRFPFRQIGFFQRGYKVGQRPPRERGFQWRQRLNGIAITSATCLGTSCSWLSGPLDNLCDARSAVGRPARRQSCSSRLAGFTRRPAALPQSDRAAPCARGLASIRLVYTRPDYLGGCLIPIALIKPWPRLKTWAATSTLGWRQKRKSTQSQVAPRVARSSHLKLKANVCLRSPESTFLVLLRPRTDTVDFQFHPGWSRVFKRELDAYCVASNAALRMPPRRPYTLGR
jgi:hypothetical protein